MAEIVGKTGRSERSATQTCWSEYLNFHARVCLLCTEFDGEAGREVVVDELAQSRKVFELRRENLQNVQQPATHGTSSDASHE